LEPIKPNPPVMSALLPVNSPFRQFLKRFYLSIRYASYLLLPDIS